MKNKETLDMRRAVLLFILVVVAMAAGIWYLRDPLARFISGQGTLLEGIKTTLEIGGILFGGGAVLWGFLRRPPPLSSGANPPGSDAETAYRNLLAQRCGDVPLSGLELGADDSSSPSQGLALEQVYVDLDTLASESDAAVKQALASGKPLVRVPAAGSGKDDTPPWPSGRRRHFLQGSYCWAIPVPARPPSSIGCAWPWPGDSGKGFPAGRRNCG